MKWAVKNEFLTAHFNVGTDKMIKMRRSDAVAVELFDVELLNAVKQYGITTADRRAVKLAGTADKRRGARYHDLIGIGKLGAGNIALDDRNTVCAA